MAAPSATAGFASCQPCHGATYAEGPYRACFACHQQGAPHPDKPWSGATPNTHALTNQGNAPVCFGCHHDNLLNTTTVHPSAAPAAGAAPGCFNNTMCHDTHIIQ